MKKQCGNSELGNPNKELVTHSKFVPAGASCTGKFARAARTPLLPLSPKVDRHHFLTSYLLP